MRNQCCCPRAKTRPMTTHSDVVDPAHPTGWFTVPVHVVRWRELDD